MQPPPAPDVHSVSFLRQHIAQTMAFYHPRAIDPAGGFFHYCKDDGTIHDRRHRHLVSSTRLVFNDAMAAIEFGQAGTPEPAYLEAARHGLRYLRDAVLSRDNRKLDDEKSPVGKTDFHTLGACHELLRVL